LRPCGEQRYGFWFVINYLALKKRETAPSTVSLFCS